MKTTKYWKSNVSDLVPYVPKVEFSSNIIFFYFGEDSNILFMYVLCRVVTTVKRLGYKSGYSATKKEAVMHGYFSCVVSALGYLPIMKFYVHFFIADR